MITLYGDNIEDVETLARFMVERGFDNIGDGWNANAKPCPGYFIEFSALKFGDDEADDVTVCRANATERQWIENSENIEAMFALVGVPFELDFEPNSVLDPETNTLIQCSEQSERLVVSRGSGLGEILP
jgi:hypothetical protein